MTEVLFDEGYRDRSKGHVRLEFLPDTHTLHLQWYGNLTHEDHTAFAETTFEYIKKKHATRWIGDVFHIIEPLPEEISHYIADTWFPESVKAGIGKVAIVMPCADTVQPSANKIAEVLALKQSRLLETLPLRGFHTREEARQWIFV